MASGFSASPSGSGEGLRTPGVPEDLRCRVVRQRLPLLRGFSGPRSCEPYAEQCGLDRWSIRVLSCLAVRLGFLSGGRPRVGNGRLGSGRLGDRHDGGRARRFTRGDAGWLGVRLLHRSSSGTGCLGIAPLFRTRNQRPSPDGARHGSVQWWHTPRGGDRTGSTGAVTPRSGVIRGRVGVTLGRKRRRSGRLGRIFRRCARRYSRSRRRSLGLSSEEAHPCNATVAPLFKRAETPSRGGSDVA